MIKNMTIKAKVIWLLVVSLSVLTVILAGFSVTKATNSLLEQNYGMLTAARDSKANQVSDFFENRISDVVVLAESSNIKDALYDLENLYDLLDVEDDKAFPVEEMMVKEATENHDAFFKHYMEEYGYYDIFIIDAQKGHVLYSTTKESDYGANLKFGPLKTSGLGEVYAKTLENQRPTFVDMRPYAPSDNKPAMFLGNVVKIEGEVEAVLVFQISDRRINKVMQFRKGYGETQEDYLVGQDKLMRSDSYLDPEGHSLEASFSKGANVDTVASKNALAGKENTEIVIDYNGNRVLSAYSPLEIGKDLKWAILSEIDEAEVLKTPRAIRNIIIIIALSLLGFVIIGAIVVINNIVVKRLTKFQEGLIGFFKYVNRESNEVEELETDSIDEIGLMSKVVNDNILKAKKGIEEDRLVIDEAISVLGEFEQGDLRQRITRTVNNPALNELRDVLNKMADTLEQNIDNILAVLDSYSNYNYITRVNKEGLKDHLEKLADGVNSLGDSVTEMLVDNKKNGLIINNSSENLLHNVDTLNQASNEAAASLEETAAALEEITANVKSSTSNISRMSDYAKEVTNSVNEGENLAKNTTTAMDEINVQVSSINEAITVIDQIAFQTNILSLNAAVEAATAGEAGKGFAVVAQEVRNLASRSAEAAKEIKNLVESANIKANEGKNIADDMIKGYESLNENINKTIELISEVSHASKEQEDGIIQINDAINSLDQQTQKNAEVASQTKEIAVNTSSLAKDIVKEVDTKQFEGKNDIKIDSVNPSVSKQEVQKQVKTETTKPKKQEPITYKDSSSDDEWESF